MYCGTDGTGATGGTAGTVCTVVLMVLELLVVLVVLFDLATRPSSCIRTRSSPATTLSNPSAIPTTMSDRTLTDDYHWNCRVTLTNIVKRPVSELTTSTRRVRVVVMN